MFIGVLRERFCGDIDFLYLPMGFKRKRNAGYAFMNFRANKHCMDFKKGYHDASVDSCFPSWKSGKMFQIEIAELQGSGKNVRQLNNNS